MTYTDNFCEASLLFCEPVKFTARNQDGTVAHSFTMDLPTVKLVQFNEDFRIILGMFHTPLDALLTKLNFPQSIGTYYQLFDTFATHANMQSLFYLKLFATVMQLLHVNCTLADQAYKQILIDGVPITEEVFEKIRQILLISCGVKKRTDFYSDPEMQKMQDKINRIKQSNQMGGNGNEAEAQINSFITLLYEFGMKPAETYNMTQYAVNLILGYTSKSIRYKVSLIAAGNGLSKKIKYITDKGK